MNLGDFRLGETFDCKFTTIDSDGAPITLAGTPVISAYPGNSTTQLTAGITLSVDFDGVTGLHNVRVVATSGNGYATATNYVLVITTGTVDAVSVVGYVVAHFSIENRSALMPTTAARTLDVSAGGEAGVDWANVGSPTTTVNLSGTTTNVVNTASAVTTVNGLAANVITATSIANDAITAAKIAAGAIDAATFAADVDAEILSYIVDDATRIDASALNTAAVTSIPAILVDTNELQTDWANGGRLDLLLDATLADTNELQTDWADGGRLDLILDARSSQASVDDLPTNAELSTALGTADDAVLTQVALVKAKTDLIPGTIDGLTFIQGWTLTMSALLGKASGLDTTTAVYRAADDSKDRITATVDADGNRTAITLDAA